MDSPELYGALAAGIARYAVDAWEHPKPPRTALPGSPEPLRAVAGSRFWGHFLNSFESACMLLFRLGVAQPIDSEGSPVTDDKHRLLYAGSFMLTVDASKIAAVVTERVSSDLIESCSFEEVLTTWLECAGHFGAISSGRERFDADPDVQDLMQALAHAGYATWRGKQFLWTDKIVPMMRSAFFWDESGRSADEVERLQTEAELRNAARSIPEDVRLAVVRGDVRAVQEALLHRWYDGAWKPGGGPPTDYYRRLATIGNATQLMDLVVDGDGHG